MSYYEIKVLVKIFAIPAFLIILFIVANIKTWLDMKEKEKRYPKRNKKQNNQKR